MAGFITTPKTDAPAPFELALRVALVSALMTGLTYLYAKPLVQALLPALQWMIGILDDHYRIVSLSISAVGADSVVRLQVTLARILVVGGKVVMPDTRGLATVTTAIGTVIQGPLLALTATMAWPFRSCADFAIRFSLVAMLMAALWAIDTPFCLWSYLWALHRETFDPDGFSALLLWQQFLNNGGRILLGLCAGLLAARASRQFIGRRCKAITSVPRPLNIKA